MPSLFRGFSAPVRIEAALSDAERLTLLAHDTDAFNRWQAAQSVGMRLLVEGARSGTGEAGPGTDAFVRALAAFLDAEGRGDPAFAALVLGLPSEADVANEIRSEVDPDAIHRARRGLRREIGRGLRERLETLHADLAEPAGAAFSPDAESAGRRSLRNAALDLIAAADGERGTALATAQLAEAPTMTDRLAALSVLAAIPGEAREAALCAFGARYADEPLVLDKWFGIQATIPEESTVARVGRLQAHPAFAPTNPNRVRALVGLFAMANPTQFNRPDGAGFRFVAKAILAIDPANPQLAARLLTAFGSWRMLEAGRRAQAKATLEEIASAPGLSRDVADILGRTLSGR